MHQNDKPGLSKYAPLLSASAVLVLILIVTVSAEINLTGYQYSYTQQTQELTVKDGWSNPDIGTFTLTENNIAAAIELMHAVDQADTFMYVNVILLILFTAVFALFRYVPSFASGKMKKYIWLYVLLFIFVLLWSITTHMDMNAQISYYLDMLEEN
ncbi:hypothetical protein [Salisediminibacterium halotolerans]|uniref:hypothetical protein n=1 Tax=Salisediminibacterium halotolerans TaxID=517425 RepID=UPI000EAD3BCD|nr:hypothetical protein [Salisediminibacterium halotolerans]RLJ73138.1 hypothetical protein BCL39_1886 [Actinophytocola xinjiangensis]RPE86560.1 hypothetical protein EDD67_2009 [Salisediminibacterium halotolerans]TWG33935.1 hypothetical protein BCL52_1883 [Salisediminibacterium halotolerans]GEL08849.1 hypothetical protein SHA02_22650 [Salisediminibacterium halotolerans]